MKYHSRGTGTVPRPPVYRRNSRRSAAMHAGARLLFSFFVCIAFPITLPGQNTMDSRTVVDFSASGEQEEWIVVNDGVMGGVSTSSFAFTGEGTATFTGTVSLDNNGGFASIRSRPGKHDLEGFTGVRLRVRGDGHRYQLRMRTNDRFDGVAYQATFSTTEGEWLSVDIPFASLQPTFRGRRVPDAAPLDPAGIRQIGVLIADGQEGDFALELRSVEAYR